MTDLEKELYNLSNRKVKISCPKRYRNSLCGLLDSFWIDELMQDKINFNIKTDGKEVVHGFKKPDRFEYRGDKLVFYVEDVEYIFEIED